VLAAEICRRAGIGPATCSNWKKKYDGLLPTEMKRLKQLEGEDGRLRDLVSIAGCCKACSGESSEA